MTLLERHAMILSVIGTMTLADLEVDYWDAWRILNEALDAPLPSFD